MSTKKFIEITDAQDYSKVLRDVATALKDSGFFDNSNWHDELIKTFEDVVYDRADDSISFITDNEHEISSSFVAEPSKFNKKSKTSISNRTERTSIVNDDMYGGSDDTFEIPETQPFPPVDNSNIDELNSEGFATMPDDGFVANDSSQSQVLLQGAELGQKSPHQPDDPGTIEMEMSKLHWDDSTKENYKNRSALVTRELNFNLITKQTTIIENIDRTCVTPDSEFEALPFTAEKSIFKASSSPQKSKVPSVPPSLDRNETSNDESSICKIDKSATLETSVSVKCAKDEDLKIEKIHRHDDEIADDAQAPKNYKAANVAKDVNNPNTNYKGNVGEGKAETNESFTKPLSPDKLTENANQCDEEMPETQFFIKSGELDLSETIEVNWSLEELVSGEITESYLANGANDIDVSVDGTQLSLKRNASSTEDDNVYNLATQPSDVSKNHLSKESHMSLGEGGSENNDKNSNDDIKVDVASNKIEEESDEPKPKLRKRNRLIESSDEEEDTATKNAVNSSHNADDIMNAPTQKRQFQTSNFVNNSSAERLEYIAAFGTPTQRWEPDTRIPESPKPKCISHLKGADWEELCNQANSSQASAVFKSVFDLEKEDLRKVQENQVSVSSASKPNVVAEARIRQSARSRTKVNYGDSNDAKTASSKRRKGRSSPTTFNVPSDSVSTNLENAPPLDVNASKDSSNAPLVSAKQDDTDENIALEMEYTRILVKASSTPKERTKPDRHQTRSRTLMEKLPEPKETKQAKNNQSGTYSPKPANVKVSSDKPEKSDDQVESSGAVPGRSQKRKAPEELTLSIDSVANSSTSSRSLSLNRTARNQCCVMFTMVDPASHRETLNKLNIRIAETGKYDVLITDKVYRTSKFLCALAAGKPIVSVKWLNALKAKKSMIDPFEFVLKDAVGEKKYQFNLAETLGAVQKNGGLCRNYSILVTPNTSPSPDILKDIIASSGGKYLKTSLVARKNDRVLCISNEDDKKLVVQLKKKYPNLREITDEQFMQGIFQYKI